MNNGQVKFINVNLGRAQFVQAQRQTHTHTHTHIHTHTHHQNTHKKSSVENYRYVPIQIPTYIIFTNTVELWEILKMLLLHTKPAFNWKY